MDLGTIDSPNSSLEERKLHEETAARTRELDLKEREVSAKEQELSRSRFLTPTALGLFAAAAALVGNVIVARVNNQSSQQLEHTRLQSNLIIEAIKTGNQDGACQNLTFFVGLGLVDDPNGTIRQVCNSTPKGAPSLPANTQSAPDNQDSVISPDYCRQESPV